MKPDQPFVSVEQQEANRIKLTEWRAQLPALMADYRRWARDLQGSKRAIGAMLECLDLILGHMADHFYVSGDAAVLNMPSTLKMQAIGLPGQRMSIVGRVREAARLGIIELWTEDEAGFKGEKIVIPLDTSLSPFRYGLAQGETYRGMTAHSRRGNQDLLRNLPNRVVNRQVGYATKSELKRLRQKANLGALMILATSERPMTKTELAAEMGVNRSTAGRIMQGLMYVGLVKTSDEKHFSPACSPCASFTRRQKNVDLDSQVRNRIRRLVQYSLKRLEMQVKRLRQRFSPTQKQVVKADRAVRALHGMLNALDAGEAGSLLVHRRYS